MKDMLKKIKCIYKPLFQLKKICLFIWLKWCVLVSILLKKKSMDVLKYKNIHKGERCFIVATGPSLTIEDLEMIKEEYSFSMNSIVNILGKTTFIPTYYMIQDAVAERKLREGILKSDLKNIFVGIGNSYFLEANLSKKSAQKYHKNAQTYNLNSAYHFFDMCYNQEKVNVQFSDDCANEIMDGFTVTYSAIQLAVYMGFKEIYLLGCDTNYAGHVDEKTDKIVPNANEPITMFLKSYEVARAYAREHGVKIYNATRGGMLEIFPRVDLESLFKGTDSI